MKPDSKPKFCKARSVQYALNYVIELELHHLQKEEVVKTTSHSQWAALVVPAPKNTGHIRLCGEYKVTINPALKVDQHPLPKPVDLFASLSSGTKFSKIDSPLLTSRWSYRRPPKN